MNKRFIYLGVASFLFLMSCTQKATEIPADTTVDIELQVINTWAIEAVDVIPNPSYAGLLNDGGLIISDHSFYTFNHFDESGNFLSKAGGRGRGPGEISDLTYAAIHPDGYIAVADMGAARISITNIYTQQTEYIDYDLGWHTRLAWVSNKLLISNSPFRIGPTNPGDVIIRFYDMDTKEKTELIHLELEMSDAPFEQITCTFCDFRYSQDMMIYTTPKDTSYRLFRLDPETGEQQLFARSMPAVRYTEQERERLAENAERFSAMTGTQQRTPEYKTRFTHFFPDHKGRLWALRNPAEGEQARLDIFSPTGAYLGSMDKPKGAISFVYGDMLLFREPSDDPDVWRGTAYRIGD